MSEFIYKQFFLVDNNTLGSVLTGDIMIVEVDGYIRKLTTDDIGQIDFRDRPLEYIACENKEAHDGTKILVCKINKGDESENRY